jgi:hypothetical protein
MIISQTLLRKDEKDFFFFLLMWRSGEFVMTVLFSVGFGLFINRITQDITHCNINVRASADES